jgi:prephenate dehydratase
MTRVAIQGVAGSYSEEAVERFFGSDAAIVECRSFEDAFAAVTLRKADNAVVPVENKIVGEIRQTMDLLEAGTFRILERLPLKVRHVLAGTVDAEEEMLISVRSHVEALKQCRKFFTLNPHLTQIVGADTASSVRRVVSEADPTRAAIGSRRAAELYGARVLREDIADVRDNWTTFFLLGN